MKDALKKILLFEICYKFFVICLANPLLREIYQTYVASRGLAFNRDMIGTFASVKGVLILVGLFVCAAVLIFYEYSVVIHLAAFSSAGDLVSVASVLKGSIWNLRSLKGPGMISGCLCFVLVLPFVHIGWINSLVPRVTVPWFIYGEMIRSTIGVVGVVAIYGAQVLLYVLLLFVPVFMVCDGISLGKAFRKELAFYRKLPAKGWLQILAVLTAWWIISSEIVKYWRRNLLDYKDFDLNFLQYLVHTRSFAVDFLFWATYTLAETVAFGAFVCLLLRLCGKAASGGRTYPVWNGDWGQVLRIVGRRGGAAFDRVKTAMRKKRYRIGAAVCVCFLGAYAVLSLQPVTDVHRPLLIGHRGCKEGIENTAEAVAAADRLNVDYAEVDVQLSKDGVPVVVHDTNLWRLAGESVNVADLNFSQLRKLQIRDRDHGEETSRIPSLEEIIRLADASDHGMGLLIELKPAGGNDEELAQAVMKLVEEYDFGQRAMFMSLYYSCIYPITRAHPEWWTGYCIFGNSGEISDAIWQYDIDFLAPEENRVSNDLVMAARERGIPVYVWTVYDTDKMRQYLEMGVSGLITDYPDLAAEEIEAFADKSGNVPYQWKGKGFPTAEFQVE